MIRRLLVEDTTRNSGAGERQTARRYQGPRHRLAADLEAAAKASDKVKPFIDGKTLRKVIVLPKKMVNLIVA